MSEHVGWVLHGWVLHDLRTTDPNMVRIDSLEEARHDVQQWDQNHPEQAGRYIVCAIVPVDQ